jgi:hypothetical protein
MSGVPVYVREAITLDDGTALRAGDARMVDEVIAQRLLAAGLVTAVKL